MSLSDELKTELPFLRRYARALTGRQDSGDALAIATLRGILQDRSAFTDGKSVRVALFQCFHAQWTDAKVQGQVGDTKLQTRAQEHLAALQPDSREVLLLTALEGFSDTEVATITGQSMTDVARLIATAQADMSAATKGSVLIIEDEPLIAMDLEAIVQEIGHTVTGIARTHAEAVELGKSQRPDLILSDIQLADNSSGIDAVRELLADLGGVPVVFVTAFPERLLTGDKPEPAFLISKPYREDQIETTVSQALFFASTETLKARKNA